MDEFDLVVVGSGSGLDVAAVAANRGLSVAVVEEGPLGGTCLNRGCIPSKMLIHRADVVETIRGAGEFGVDAAIEDIDYAGMVREVTDVVSADSDAIVEGLEASEHHTLFRETGRFVGERTLAVGDELIYGERVVVAAGMRPHIPPIDGIDGVDYLTSREALRLETLPDHLVVVGGGYVGVELAYVFGAMGSELTVVQRRDVLLPDEDESVSEAVTDAYEDRFELLCGHEATDAWQDDGGITVSTVGRGGATTDVTCDGLLLAAGRRPNTDRLAPEKGGIETDERGFVVTDRYLRTTAENVWALGDVIDGYEYKHAANHEASYVITNALGDPDHQHPVDYTAMPHGVFASPQVGTVGETEQALRRAGREYAVGRYDYADTAMGLAMNEPAGFVKVLADPETAEILGCHVVGPDAVSLIHEVVVAMKSAAGTVDDVRDAVHVHPATNEVVHRAFAGPFHLPAGQEDPSTAGDYVSAEDGGSSVEGGDSSEEGGHPPGDT